MAEGGALLRRYTVYPVSRVRIPLSPPRPSPSARSFPFETGFEPGGFEWQRPLRLTWQSQVSLCLNKPNCAPCVTRPACCPSLSAKTFPTLGLSRSRRASNPTGSNSNDALRSASRFLNPPFLHPPFVLSVAATAAESKHPNALALRLCRQLFLALRYTERTVAAPSRRSRTSAFVLHPNPWSADTRCRVPTLLLRLRLQAIPGRL